MFSPRRVALYAVRNAPSYVLNHFDAAVLGFVSGLAICLSLWGAGSLVANAALVLLWCVIAAVLSYAADRAIVVLATLYVAQVPKSGNEANIDAESNLD